MEEGYPFSSRKNDAVRGYEEGDVMSGKCPQVPGDEQNASQDNQLPPLIFGQGGTADPVSEAPHAHYEKKVGQLMGIEAFRRAMCLDGECLFSRSQDKKEGKWKYYGEKTLHNELGLVQNMEALLRLSS
ncbi:MAG: hypothetical protein ACYDBT_00220 [Desulfobulbaceae bacterium]